MPREIIHISVGQCGNQLGHVFWKRMLKEHNIKDDGYFNMHENLNYEDFFKLDKIGVYFDEGKEEDRFVPRSVMVDLEPGVIDKVLHSSIGSLFHPDYTLKRASGAGNNFAKGHYTIGSQIIDETMDIIRRQSEPCDCFQGFQLTHSIGGGTGSGFGTLLLEKLKDDYPDRINCAWSIYPTQKVSDIVVEPYNAILTISHLLNDTDCTFVTDNEALFNISQNTLKQKNPSFADLNWIMSLVMGGVTASLRFPGILNCDLRKMAVNLIPFPRLHFFSTSYSPLIQQGQEWQLTNWGLSRISLNVWNPKNLLVSSKKEDGKFLSATVMYRGKGVSSAEVEQITKKHLDLESDHFVEWIPHNVKTAIITLKPLDVAHTATMVGNITSVKDVIARIWQFYAKLFEKKAFIHWYRNEGMHEMEFIDAENAIKDLIMEYNEKNNVVIDYDNLFANDEDYEVESEESLKIDLDKILAEKDSDDNDDEEERKQNQNIVTKTRSNSPPQQPQQQNQQKQQPSKNIVEFMDDDLDDLLDDDLADHDHHNHEEDLMDDDLDDDLSGYKWE